MPVKSAKQWRFMGAARSGNLKSAGGPSAATAKEFMDKTPDKKRRAFAQSLNKNKKPKKFSGIGMNLLKEMK